MNKEQTRQMVESYKIAMEHYENTKRNKDVKESYKTFKLVRDVYEKVYLMK